MMNKKPRKKRRREDFELGTQVGDAWARHADGKRIESYVEVERIATERIGALVRLVREMVRHAGEIEAEDGRPIDDPEMLAWLSEAKALVGEVNDE